MCNGTCSPNPLPAVCFQNGGPLQTMDLEKVSTSQKKALALQANASPQDFLLGRVSTRAET